jgi:ArsR family transcriptional regulator
MAKAIGHPARLAILQTISARQECICGEIVEVLPLAQSTVSQHLSELKQAGLICGTISGTKSCYCIDWKGVQNFIDQYGVFAKMLQENSPKESCC